MSLIPALVQELLKIFFGGLKAPPLGWNRIKITIDGIKNMIQHENRSMSK